MTDFKVHKKCMYQRLGGTKKVSLSFLESFIRTLGGTVSKPYAGGIRSGLAGIVTGTIARQSKGEIMPIAKVVRQGASASFRDGRTVCAIKLFITLSQNCQAMRRQTCGQPFPEGTFMTRGLVVGAVLLREKVATVFCNSGKGLAIVILP